MSREINFKLGKKGLLVFVGLYLAGLIGWLWLALFLWTYVD